MISQIVQFGYFPEFKICKGFRLQSKKAHMTFLELAIENEVFTATDITLSDITQLLKVMESYCCQCKAAS